jgi:hypothetical protein
MITGDNILTAIQAARTTQFIEKNTDVYIIDFTDGGKIDITLSSQLSNNTIHFEEAQNVDLEYRTSVETL